MSIAVSSSRRHFLRGALKVLTPARVPLIASYTGTRALRTDDYPLYFTTQANYFDETTRIIPHLTTVATGRVAVMYQDDAFGKSMLPMVQKAAADAAATVLLAQPMDASGKNADEAAQAVGEVKPQSVVLLVAGPGVVPAIRALRRSVSAPIYTYSLAISAAAVEALMLSAWPWCVPRPTRGRRRSRWPRRSAPRPASRSCRSTTTTAWATSTAAC